MKKFAGLFIALASGVSFSVARAITISSAIPGSNTISTSSSPGAFVANFYQFALIIGGILAFGVIVYGGVRYMTSAGNPSGQSDAKEWIESALLGLLLLAGAYFILGVVNPQLKQLNLPSLTGANVQTTATTNPAGAPAGTTPSGSSCTPVNGTSNGSCAAGQTCDSTGIGYVCHGLPTDQTACGGSINGTCSNSGQTCLGTYGTYSCTWTCAINGNGTGSCPNGQSCTKNVYGAYCQ